MARRLYLAVRTAVAAVFFMPYTILIATLIVSIALVRQDAPLVQRLILHWSRVFIGLTGSSIDIFGSERIDSSGQYVFVANHLSNADIPAMFLTAPVPIRYLAKKEVYRIPMVGLAMRRIGMVRVDRERGSAIHAEVNAGVAEATARGHSLIIFPEGTRAVGGEPAPFKKGAFRIAIANDLPIVPVTIEGTWEVWRPGAKTVTPGRIRTMVHEPIPTHELTLADIDDVRDQARHAIVEGWEWLRTGVDVARD
jgi:1-acyl-sn-glycerol-3-phosphate acyltransferase